MMVMMTMMMLRVHSHNKANGSELKAVHQALFEDTNFKAISFVVRQVASWSLRGVRPACIMRLRCGVGRRWFDQAMGSLWVGFTQMV
jgi:hypothetical protein